MAQTLLSSSLQSASFNIVFQILLRCITFLLNAFVLRYVGQDVIGVMNVRLLLLESTILFLSREAFRRACLSQSGSTRSWPQIINLLWLTVPLSCVVALLFGLIWVHLLVQPSSEITTHYVFGVWSMAISCIIEILSEPLYLVAQTFLFIKLQVVMNGFMVFIRTLIFAPWVIHRPHQAVLAFSTAQLIANSAYSLGYYLYFYFYIKKHNSNVIANYFNKKTEDTGKNESMQRQSSIVGIEENFPFRSLSQLLPSKIPDEPWVHPNSLKLTWSFLKQGVLKQLLTEGERYVMTLFSVMSFNEQGVYDIVNNLGSLAARFLFRPIEDASYFYFSQSVKRDAAITEQNQERMKEVAEVLYQVLRCISSLGLIILTFGQSYSALLLHLYGGPNLSSGSGPVLLRAHCLSVFLLAVNGITECYAFATMTSDKLDRYNYWMAFFSVSFLLISWLLTRIFGGLGFIMANCVNMTARIGHSLFFINARYHLTPFQPLNSLYPWKPFLLSLLFSFMITKITEIFYSKLVHVMVGFLCLLFVLVIWAKHEEKLIRLTYNKWKKSK